MTFCVHVYALKSLYCISAGCMCLWLKILTFVKSTLYSFVHVLCSCLYGMSTLNIVHSLSYRCQFIQLKIWLMLCPFMHHSSNNGNVLSDISFLWFHYKYEESIGFKLLILWIFQWYMWGLVTDLSILMSSYNKGIDWHSLLQSASWC